MVNPNPMIARYIKHFGEQPTVCVRAPGRVNLIGEHVDYNSGVVMPIAIDQATYAVAGRSDESIVRIFSEFADTQVQINLDEPGPPLDGWGAYAQGVIAGLQMRGIHLHGVRILLGGDLPPGAGLSSSAALEASIALAILHLSDATLPREEIAELCRTAERDFAGVPCGIMDPWACLMSREGHVMLLDCREDDEAAQFIRWPDGDTAVLIIDSRSPHRLSAGTYSERVNECELVLKKISDCCLDENGMFVRTFRDMSMAYLDCAAVHMDRALYRRARHVVSEIARVIEAAEALRAADFETFGRLMNDSHRSLSLDYEVSSPRMDELATIVRGVPGVWGARMTGGGMGGCVVALAPAAVCPLVESIVRSAYDRKYGVTARVWSVQPREGAAVMPTGS